MTNIQLLKNHYIIIVISIVAFSIVIWQLVSHMSTNQDGEIDSPKIVQKMESKTIPSITEFHPGRADHQFVIVLPPNGKIYDGIITWVASKPVLPAVLHGPLTSSQERGQFVSSIDQDKTRHAITVVGPEVYNGTYSFVGSGLVLHNAENQHFWVSYSISYKEQDVTEAN